MPVELLHYSSTVVGATAPEDAPYQLNTALKLAIAGARGDEAVADDCWGTIQAAFARQTKAGDFGNSPTSTAFWLAELSRSLLVVQQSALAPRFKDRIEALKPSLDKALRWLVKQRSRMLFDDRAAPDRLFAEAEAFLFCGRLLGDASLMKLSQDFLDAGLKSYRTADGAFLENNGTDSGYQAACLVRLQEILLQSPDTPIGDVIAKAMQWQLAHLGPDGGVRVDGKPGLFARSKLIMGPEKTVNVGEISLALLYHYGRTGDAKTLATVEQLQKRYAPKP